MMLVFTEVLKTTILRGEVLYLTICYLLLEPVLLGTGLVDKTRGSYRSGMVVYNAIMSVFSFVCCLCVMASVGLDYGYLQWLRDLTGQPITPLWTEEVCPSPLFDNKLFVGAAYAFHLSKYVEYMDTAWLVLKGKPVSFLQRFHHVGAAWDTFLAVTFKFEGFWIFVILNAFIHTFMYAYYGTTAAGINGRVLRMLKPLMTIMQIVQFILGFTLVYPYIHTRCVRESPEQIVTYVYNYAYVGSVLLLFLAFFVNDNFGKKERGEGPYNTANSGSKKRSE